MHLYYPQNVMISFILLLKFFIHNLPIISISILYNAYVTFSDQHLKVKMQQASSNVTSIV